MTRITNDAWPDLPYEVWRPTAQTLHLWTQIVGKVRLAKTPWLNHSWQATLYVSPRGLTTSPVWDGNRVFDMELDFVEHALQIRVSTGEGRRLPLEGLSVATFYAGVMRLLGELKIDAHIHGSPNEVADPIPFAEDTTHADYDPEYAARFWRVLLQVDRVLKRFRSGYLGKSSPVHLFWGSFDMAVTRFSGRRAPLHPGGIPHLPDDVTREAYSHEVSSAGFWPGGGPADYAAFYSYAYPAPDGFADARVKPAEAFFHREAGEFLLPYDAVRSSAHPDETLLAFLQSTYEAAANLAKWPRPDVECAIGEPGVPREVAG